MWGADPFLDDFFLIGNDLFSISQTVDKELGLAPTSHARPRDTEHPRPSNLAARSLSLVEHTLSKVGDPCPVRRGIAAAVKCCLKSTFFPLLLNRTTGQSPVWVSTSTPQRDDLFCFLFSGTIIVGLTPDYKHAQHSAHHSTQAQKLEIMHVYPKKLEKTRFFNGMVASFF